MTQATMRINLKWMAEVFFRESWSSRVSTRTTR
jgi:hypothetical protein